MMPFRGTPFAVCRRRRSFGLDVPRPPDLRRTEAAILDWLGTHAPQVFCLKAEREEGSRAASTLMLLLPAGRSAVLRIETGPERGDARTVRLAEHCRQRRVPIAVVSGVDETRAALRRLGIEPEDF